jgi:mannose-6-phosphate isomerase-like protein (cupin superfamily)
MRIEFEDVNIPDQDVPAILAEAGVTHEAWGLHIPPERLRRWSIVTSTQGGASATVLFRTVRPHDLHDGGELHHTHLEHTDDVDERRYVILGTGTFNVRRRDGRVVVIHIDPGDFVSIGPGRYHWFEVTCEALQWIEIY